MDSVNALCSTLDNKICCSCPALCRDHLSVKRWAKIVQVKGVMGNYKALEAITLMDQVGPKGYHR